MSKKNAILAGVATGAAALSITIAPVANASVVGDAVGAANAAKDHVASTVSGVKDQAVHVAGRGLDQAQHVINSGLDNVSESYQAVDNVVRTASDRAFGAIDESYQAYEEGGLPAVGYVNTHNGFENAKSDTQLATDAINHVNDNVRDEATWVAGELGTNATESVQAVSDGFDHVAGHVQGGFEGLGHNINDAIHTGADIAGNFVDTSFVTNQADQALDNYLGVVGGVSDFVSGQVGGAFDHAHGVIDGVQGAVQNTIDTAHGVATGATSATGENVSNAIGGAQEFLGF